MRLEELYRAYRGEATPLRADWPQSGVAITGDFGGIQRFVLKPVPGAKGAAKRLRGRSLLVTALTQLAAEEARELFPDGRLFYQAGGRFLVFAASPPNDWRDQIQRFQGALDRFFLGRFRGETVFHLAAVEFRDGKIPHSELSEALHERRNHALSESLRDGSGKWNPESFWNKPGKQAFRCPACLCTADEKSAQSDEDGVEICSDCHGDKTLGGRLAGLQNPSLEPGDSGEIEFLGRKYKLGNRGMRLDVVHHLPREKGGDAAALEEIAERAVGSRKYLGYLRLDADRIGKAFRGTGGDPLKTLALSRFLQGFFCGEVQRLISLSFPNIYPVYGGGDDLFVIGPWDQTLKFSGELRERFRKIVDDNITFSAAMALSKPRQHILTKSEEAEHALAEHAKAERRAIHALGETIPWNELPGLLQRAEKLTRWKENGTVASAFLRDVLVLHQRWKAHPDDARFRPFLHYQIERNLGSHQAQSAREWGRSLLEPEDADWRRAGFLVRYAMLASKQPQELKTDKE